MSKYAYERDMHNPPPGAEIEIVDVTWSRDDAVVTIEGGTNPKVFGSTVHFHSNNYPDFDGWVVEVDVAGGWSIARNLLGGSIQMEAHPPGGGGGPQISIQINS